MFCQETERKTAAELHRHSESSRGRARASLGGERSRGDGSGSVPLVQPEDAAGGHRGKYSAGHSGEEDQNLPVAQSWLIYTFFEARVPNTPLFVSFLDGAAALSSLSPRPSLFIAMSLLAALRVPKGRTRPRAKGRGSRAATRLHKQAAAGACATPNLQQNPQHSLPPPPGGWMREQCLPKGQGAGHGGSPRNAGGKSSDGREVTAFLATGSCFPTERNESA